MDSIECILRTSFLIMFKISLYKRYFMYNIILLVLCLVFENFIISYISIFYYRKDSPLILNFFLILKKKEIIPLLFIEIYYFFILKIIKKKNIKMRFINILLNIFKYI